MLITVNELCKNHLSHVFVYLLKTHFLIGHGNFEKVTREGRSSKCIRFAVISLLNDPIDFCLIKSMFISLH